MLKFALVPLMLALSVDCLADLKLTSPETACAFLSDSGLKGRKWTDYGDGTSGCASNYKDIGTGSPLANNLAYYALGSGSTVDQVKLVLNFNQPKTPGPSVQALGKAAEKLTQKALGAALPASIKKAIALGQPQVAAVGTGSVEVLREEWPTGKGYEVHVIMR
ncbi:hypothetical protein BFW87_26540 [Pseudomonas fluorescens]|uniref:Lipoprotein n=1 Tax=Pseudomonas fluorescens TaxID=294 RepID=A0A1T2Y2D8_PSEFL|nr:hypothetical protein [Pseudomonas fluorescens]OPA86300.1 hypothetical protein BFW87_26540 [Pseudomonas fluorescens]